MADEQNPLEAESDKRKEAKKKRKEERRQARYLNSLSETRWQRLGSVASWVGYRVQVEGQEEIVPVRRGRTKIELISITNNLKRVVRRQKELELKKKKKKKKRPKRVRM